LCFSPARDLSFLVILAQISAVGYASQVLLQRFIHTTQHTATLAATLSSLFLSLSQRRSRGRSSEDELRRRRRRRRRGSWGVCWEIIVAEDEEEVERELIDYCSRRRLLLAVGIWIHQTLDLGDGGEGGSGEKKKEGGGRDSFPRADARRGALCS